MLPTETINAIDAKPGDRLILPDATRPHAIKRVREGKGAQAGQVIFDAGWGPRALRRYDQVQRVLVADPTPAG